MVYESIRDLQHRALSFAVKSNPNLGLEDRAEGFVKIFEKFLPDQSRVLDIGGGWGFYHEPLKQRGHHTTVIDVVKPGIQKCPVIIYDGGQMPFEDKSFDVSMFVTVLHHIPDIDHVVNEALRVTRKRLIVVEDLYNHPMGRLWTVLRDQIYNFEFFGHPKNFKKSSEWNDYFRQKGLDLIFEQELTTRLTGLSILNGVKVFDLCPGQTGLTR